MMIVFVLLALVLGASVSLQGAVNGNLASRLGLPSTLLLNAALVTFGTLVWWALAPRHAHGTHSAAPWFWYTGGLWGLLIITCAAIAFPRLGAGATTLIAVAAQAAVALALDHFGATGERFAITPMRMAGCALCAVGALLVVWPKLS